MRESRKSAGRAGRRSPQTYEDVARPFRNLLIPRNRGRKHDISQWSVQMAVNLTYSRIRHQIGTQPDIALVRDTVEFIAGLALRDALLSALHRADSSLVMMMWQVHILKQHQQRNKQHQYVTLALHLGFSHLIEGNPATAGTSPCDAKIGTLSHKSYPNLLVCSCRNRPLAVYWTTPSRAADLAAARPRRC